MPYRVYHTKLIDQILLIKSPWKYSSISGGTNHRKPGTYTYTVKNSP